MQIRRLLRHAFSTDWALHRAFDPATLAAIEAEITVSERTHGGEIRFAIEGSLPVALLWQGSTPRDRALHVFAELGVWNTVANNGALIYVLWADRAVEIVADRGLNGMVSPKEWSEVCRRMEKVFAKGAARQAALLGIQGVGALLAQHFPAHDRDELANRPVLL